MEKFGILFATLEIIANAAIIVILFKILKKEWKQ